MSNPASPRPAKRPRHSEEAQDTQSPTSSSTCSTLKLQRHPEFWFQDGSIVLVARHTGFRIYSGLLSYQSTIFSDMFASATSNTEETFDGCPIVHLSDSPHDIEHLLHVLLPKTRIYYQMTDVDPARTFEEVSALVRLVHKYHIQAVQDQALAALQLRDFTSNFKTFRTSGSKKKLVHRPAESIGAVNLARLTDTPSILPLAMYNCTYLDTAILDGWKRCDGTIEELSPADLRRCINGRITLGREQFALLSRLFRVMPSYYCCSVAGHCKKALRTIHDNAVPDWNSTGYDALSDWESALQNYASEHELCESCEDMLLDLNRRERRKVWNKLPKIFVIEVEEWGEPESEDENSY